MNQRTGTGVGHHVCMLGLSMGILAVGCFLRVSGPETVGMGDSALPSICLWRSVSDVGCPGCGLTRSLVAFCHLHPLDAWRFHPAGCLIVAVAILQISYRLFRLFARGEDGRFFWVPRVTHGTLVLALGVGLTRWVAQVFSLEWLA